MGKTKTAFIGEVAREEKSSKQKYEEKRLKKKVQEEALKEEKGVEKVITEEKKIDKKSLPNKTQKTRGKKYLSGKEKIAAGKTYPLDKAIEIIKQVSYSKFDGTIEMHIICKKHPLNINITLPNSFGKEKKVVVADEKVIKELSENKINFDVLLATSDMMPKLVPFARILGPKGLMPNPKNGTIIKSAKDASKFSTSSIALKTEKEAPLIHTSFGKISMDDKKLTENAQTILKPLNKQIVKVYVKSTMSPSVRLSV